MNSTSFGESGVSVARVEGGSVRVGWPGGPGCTMTGVLGSACCAETESDKKHPRVPAAKNPLRNTGTLITDSSFGLAQEGKNFIDLE